MSTKVNTMKKYIILVAVLWIGRGVFAHSPDTSTVVLAERENHVWILQINASLTAFQQEVKTHFSDTPYKTPEEFQEMVISHIKNTLQIRFNNGKDFTLGKGVVMLGHETKVVFEVLNVPTSLESVHVTNKIFGDINRNQSALMIFKKGFAKEYFNLNKSNDHMVSLMAQENKFIETSQQNADVTPSLIILAFIGLMGIGFLVKKMVGKGQNSVIENN